MPTRLRIPLLAFGGLAIAAAFLDPRTWPLAWLALIPLFAVVPRDRTVRAAALDGWWMGLATNVPAFYWLVETMTRFGGFPRPVALFFYAVLSAYSALQFALVAAALRWAGPGAPVLLGAALWTASEFLFPNLFPWRLAHSQRLIPPLIQIGDATGPYGLTFLMAWVASAIARGRPLPRRLAPALIATALVLAYGGWRIGQVRELLGSSPPFSVGIVQGNLALDEKRHADHFDANVARYRLLSDALRPPPDLLVWPETVVEWGIPHGARLTPSIDPYPDAPAPLLFGAVSYRASSRDRAWFNSAFLRSSDGSLSGRYDKIVLMPFGEFIPLASVFPSLKDLSPNTGDFTAGPGPGVLSLATGARVGTLICYEDLLAGHVRDTVRSGAQVLVAITNDAWFGDTAALHQHESLALWRAIENRRYLVRATNSGLSGVVDPLGSLALTLPTARATAGKVEVRLIDADTPYQRLGDTFGWFVVALAVGLLVYARRSRNRAKLQEVALRSGTGL